MTTQLNGFVLWPRIKPCWRKQIWHAFTVDYDESFKTTAMANGGNEQPADRIVLWNETRKLCRKSQRNADFNVGRLVSSNILTRAGTKSATLQKWLHRVWSSRAAWNIPTCLWKRATMCCPFLFSGISNWFCNILPGIIFICVNALFQYQAWIGALINSHRFILISSFLWFMMTRNFLFSSL